MKISQKSKRAVSPHPHVAELVTKLINTQNDDLADVLADIDIWKWPRSDLNAWTKVLDKFDAILEEAIRDYDVDKLQINVFTPATKKIICHILRFERLLLENSTNRKTFSSYDRLNSLLFTSDLDVLTLSLNLLLRPAQQYSAQPAVSTALSISTSRLLSLSKRWPHVHEHGMSLLDLVSANGLPQIDILPAEAREVNFVYYRTEQSQGKETDNIEVSLSTPHKLSVPLSTSHSHAPTIHIDDDTLKKKDVMEILADILETHPLDNEDKFELLCRLRSAKALATGDQIMREKLVIIRLLSIAIYGHTHSEGQASSTLFLYEPDLTTHIAELLQLDRGVSIHVQTAAISALDSVARYRGKLSEVLGAVNAAVNHGILMALLRKTILDVSSAECKLPPSFVESLLSFVTYLAQHTNGGNMLVGAGLVPLLVQIMENRLAQRLQIVSKAMQLVDNILYAFSNAFQVFSNSRGVEVLVGRIQHEVDFDIMMYGNERSKELFGSYGQLPVPRAAVLKHTLRSMHRMMQSTGTSEGLRGLIDSTLPQSIKKIMEYRGLFGPNLLPLSMNIMATFIHNEPTSLPTIQEVGLPQVFYKVIEAGLEPVIEVVQAIPNAIGALCLNQVGQDQLATRPSVIPGIISIFTSEKHIKVLREKENAVLIGTAVDELIRHHPTLKIPVFEAVKSALSKIEDLGKAFVIPGDKREWYGLTLASSTTDQNDVIPMDVVESEVSTSDAQEDMPEDDSPTDHDNNIVLFIDVICRFLEGLFQHTQHCKDFIRIADGLERVCRLTGLPCLPYDYANNVSSDSLVQVVRTMADVGPNEALHHLSKLVENSLSDSQSFWETPQSHSKLAPFIDLSEEQECTANQQFRSLVTLHIRITVMADVFSNAGYAHGRSVVGLLQTLMSEPTKVIRELGALHRASIWENILFKATMVAKGMDVGSSSQGSPLGRSPSYGSAPLPEPNAGITTNGAQAGTLSTSAQPSSPAPMNVDTPREKNAKALKHLIHGLPTALAPFFQAIVKLFYARRNPDSTQKKQILAASVTIADIMVEHLKYDITGDQVCCLDYHTAMLSLAIILLVDERTINSTLHTVLLLAFQRANGLEDIFRVGKYFTDLIGGVSEVKAEDRTETMQQELTRAQGGLSIALRLLSPILSSKSLIESGQTSLVTTRDKKDTEPDYFEPHHFLVWLRLKSIPFLRGIWEAPWLCSLPVGLVKSVVKIVLEVTAGENEEMKSDPPHEVVTGGTSLAMGSGFHLRAAGPDENRISQLTDMGFPRSAAERALVRTHNNVSAATELLLNQPFPLPADSQPNGAVTEEDSAGDAPANEAEEDPSDEEAELEDSTPIVPPAESTLPPQSISVEPMKGLEELRKELNEARESLKTELIRRALQLVDEHPSLIFEVHRAFMRPTDGLQEQPIRTLIDDIQSFSPAPYDVQEQPLATRCRLLALVLTESPVLSQALGQSLMGTLLALLLSNPVRIDSSFPKWLASHLLVTEALFTISEQPSTVPTPKEGEPVATPNVSVGPAYANARPIVFDFCLRLLAVPDLPRDELLSTLRLLVLLTRDHGTASELIKRDRLPHLFSRLKSCVVPEGQSYVVIILRHIAEELYVLQRIMKQEIKRFFSQPRTRVIDISGYLRNCSAVALRDPSVFIQATQDLCQLQQPFSTIQHITLKPETPQSSGNASTAERNDMQVDQPAPSQVHEPDTEALETMVHFLISELAKNVRSSDDGDVATKHEDATLNTSENVDTSKDLKGLNEQDRLSYCCFVMQCLTELLFSYDACKLAFLSYSPKRKLSTPAKDPSTKHRTAVLQFFLSDLVTFRTVTSQPDAKAKQSFSLCTWAMSVLVALCVDSSAGAESKEISADLISVRKFTLEAISRAIKEHMMQENLDARYGRLLALADLCNRLLTVRFNNGSRKLQDESTTHIAKIMLEKNFVSILTNALAEVDLNYPNVRGLVASILRPMENLTRIAIKMSRAADKTKDGGDGKVSRSAISISDDEDDDENIDVDVEDDDREETPDLYRNSALGMFGGEMEDMNYSQEDEMAEEDEDEDGDVDMEYGDETDSAATSNSDDELEGGRDDDVDEASNGDEWHDEDEEYEEDDLIENEDDEDDDEPHAGDEVDEEIMWQDIRADDGGDEVVDDAEEEEEDEDEEHGEPVTVIHANEGDEPDILSDDEEFQDEMSIGDERHVFPDLSFRFTDAVEFEGGELDGRDENPFTRRRNLGEDVQVFGRPRHLPIAPPEATVHPLLLDASAPTSRPVGLARVGRRSNRGGGVQQEIIHSIEDIIGGDAAHIFQHIIDHRGSVPEAIRVDVAPGALMDLGWGLLRSGAPGVRVDGVRMDRITRPSDARGESRFDPLLTAQRWAEEARTLNGKHVSDRANRLGNHIAIALLPAAIEASKQREQQQRQAQIKAEEAEALQVEADPSAAEEAGSSSAVASHASPEDIARPPAEPPTSDPPHLSTITSVADVEMDDIQASTGDEDVAGPEAPTIEEMSTVEEVSSPSQPPPSERVTVMIHGGQVDITDMGIDPTFLEALPDDIREEVINQHVRDQRAARVERPADSQISPEFLDALPPEIRAELIQQERMEQSRHTTAPVPRPGPPGVPADIDPASFIASLDPQLRQVVLMDSDDGLLQSLPSYMIAEAGVYRDEAVSSRGGIPTRAFRTAATQRPPPPRKLPPPRDAIQLLDKAGVATLVRLLFFPHVLKKNLLFKILVNICENSKTRSELFNLLLSILQSGPGDLAAVDKSFAQMTTRTPKSAALQTPKAAGKSKATVDLSTPVAIGGFQVETVPDLVVQRCLEAMTYIVSVNEQSSLFFLTEHELPASLRRMPSRKGKGKEKPIPQTHFPIVLLLGLLDRQSLLKTPSTMDSVVTLLSTVTKPLAGLKSDKKEQPNEIPPDNSAPAVTVGVVAPGTSESAVVQELAGSTNSPKPNVAETDAKPLLAIPPQIPHSVLRLIVNILAVGECSSRTFQQSLALIQNLSHIPDARDIIAQELKTKAQDCGHAILTDLGDLIGALTSSRDDVLASSVAPKFSSPSSDQTKLLRVLKTIDYMYTPRVAGPVTDETRKSEDAEKVQTIYESFHFAPLWRRLGECLSAIEKKPELEHIAIVLLPLIEALMVVCKYVGSKSAVARALRAVSPRSPTTCRESMEDLFVSFTDAHRKVLNLMVRNNPSLMSGSFSLLVHNPRVLDFDNKRNYFTQQLHRRPHSREHQGTLQLNVRRARVFEDSFQYLQRKTGDQIKNGKLSVRFYDEEGVDAGGVTREWFQILARQMFDPNNALFQPCAADRLTYQPNKNSWVNPEHLSFFKFVGRIIGKAIYDGRLLDAYFAKSIYRQLLGKPVDYRDVEWVDPEYYNSLCWIMDNDPTPLDLTFSVEADEFGVNRIFTLKEGGESIPVTQENKREFVQLSANFRLYSSISNQIENLVAGFQEIIPKDLITIFNEQELELLISGTPDIDVDEWRAATEYNGYTSSDPVVVWWWRALKSFNREERAKVLSFATGTSRVPLGGFVDLQGVQGVQRFSIHRAYGDPDRLPQAHTCFNQIDLPQYSSYEMLRQQLLLAINEGGEGFGFA